jgi:lysozyme
MPMNVLAARAGERTNVLRHPLTRALMAAGLAAALLVLPASRGPNALPFQPTVAEAASVAAQSGCPPTLRQGSRGDNVEYLQTVLNTYTRRWYWVPIAEDGEYGPKTTERVTMFQRKWNYEGGSHIDVDGVAGPQTWNALGAC